MNPSDRIISVLKSAKFREQIASFALPCANVKQERLLLYLLAQQLTKKKCVVNLEYKRTDMILDGTEVEAKYHFDCDLPKIQEWLCENQNKDKMNAALKGKISGWNGAAHILRDIAPKNKRGKEADIFLWIVVCRDLPEKFDYDDPKARQYCWAKQSKKYNGTIQKSKRVSQAKKNAGDILDRLKEFRNFEQDEATAKINMPELQATYLFYVCDFIT